jgi:hypothetical protein
MWNPFRRRLRGWVSISNYYRLYERERKRNPSRFELEEEQSRQWALRVFEKRTISESETSRATKGKEQARERAMGLLKEQVREAFMTHPAATDADFTQCWPSLRHELLKKYALEQLAANRSDIDALLGQFFQEKRAELFFSQERQWTLK